MMSPIMISSGAALSMVSRSPGQIAGAMLLPSALIVTVRPELNISLASSSLMS
jgi:hypothetical protein